MLAATLALLGAAGGGPSRLSTVVSAGPIVVLEDGRVRAVGRHAELVKGDGLYAELAATQFTAA